MDSLSDFYKEAASHMEDVYTVLRKSKITFSKTQAMEIVGGRSNLELLRREGKIRVHIRDSGYRMGQWECNPEDIIRYAIDKLDKRKNST